MDIEHPDTVKNPVSLGKQLKRLFWMFVAIGLVWLVFEQAIPRLLFKQAEAPMVTQAMPIEHAVPPTQIIPTTPVENTEAPALPAPAEDAPMDAVATPAATMPFTPAPDVVAVEQLKAQLSKANVSKQRILWWQAYDRLKEALLKGHPFHDELLSFQLATGSNARLNDIISPIVPFADSGIPLFDRLQDNFSTAIPKALALDSTEQDQDEHWLKAFLHQQFAQWVTVRRVGERVGTDATSIIARAEAALNDRKLEIALQEIESLPPSTSTPFASFVRDAKAALLREEALKKLREVLVMEENAL